MLVILVNSDFGERYDTLNSVNFDFGACSI